MPIAIAKIIWPDKTRISKPDHTDGVGDRMAQLCGYNRQCFAAEGTATIVASSDS